MRCPRPVRFYAASALTVFVVFALACGQPSDEERIRALLKDAVALAEKKDTNALAKLFAPDYADFEGRDSAGTLRLITDYLESYRGVVIHLLGTQIGTIRPDGRASVECEVSLSHGAAEVLRRLIRYTGEYYRFEIDLRKTGPGGWRFGFAKWRSLSLIELFPESLDILKKLFPGL